MTSKRFNGQTPGNEELPDEPGKTVDDEENRSQNATIRRIQGFRDEIAEYQLLFAQNELTGEISEAQQHRSYHQLARGFLQLLKPYLTDDELPRAEYYWDKVHLGSFTIEPPAVISQPSQQEMAQAVRGGDKRVIARADARNDVDSRSYSVEGLKDFASAPPEWQVEWKVMYGPEVSPSDLRAEINDPNVRVQPRSTRNEPITVVRTARIPRQIIDGAVTALENFVRELGLDIEWDEEEHQTKIDRDLLEEVEEWRQQNVE